MVPKIKKIRIVSLILFSLLQVSQHHCAHAFASRTVRKQQQQQQQQQVEIKKNISKDWLPNEDETTTVDVAIVGGGPSGLVLSHSLIDRGFKVKVLERRSTFRPVGSAVFLHPFALLSLENLSPSVARNVRNASTQVGTVTVQSINKMKNRFEFDKLDDAPAVFGNPFVTIKFWDLLQALKKGLPEDIFSFGSDVVGYNKDKQDEKGFTQLTYKQYGDDDDVLHTVNAKIIIDTSGIRSKIRKQLLPESKAVPFCKAYMAVLPAEKAESIIRNNQKKDAMVERELGFLVGDVDGMTLATLKNGDVWWTYTYFDDELSSSLSTEELVKRVDGRYPSFVIELMRSTSDRIETVIADLPVSWNWGEDNVTLLGDAAHAQLPALGLGCSAAFADIEELCKQIDSVGLTSRALRWYERLRMPQTAVLQAASRFTYGSLRNLGNQ